MDFFAHGTERLLPNLLDVVIMAVYIILIFLVSHLIQKRYIEKNPAYRFYKWGLFAKIFAAVIFCIVYTLYYTEGGDATMYFRNSQSLVKLLFNDPGQYLYILFGGRSPEVYYWFDSETGWPWMYRDPESFVVVRLTSVFTLLGAGSFFTTTILVAWVSYIGIWRLYLLFTKQYPGLETQFAIGILFFPSLVFWGSGILKDSYSILAIGLFTYSFYKALILKQKIILNLIVVLFSSFLIFIIKPYIIVALLPGSFLWLAFYRLKKIKNTATRWTVAPVLTLVFLLAALGVVTAFSAELGDYGSIESIIRKAQITQDDLKRAEAYSENFFDIGDLDGTLSGFVKLAPAAVVAGIFRPFLWEAGNPLIMLSAIENTILIIITLLILIRTGPIRVIKITANEPLVIFSLLFALIFAFSVGLTTANFGALVRLRIPLLPFFAGALVVINHLLLKWKKEHEIQEL